MLKRLLRDRRGISITEVVVAMTMVLIITGSAISVQIASTRADLAYRDKYYALNACENAAACLRSFADGDQQQALDEAMALAGFDKIEGVYTLRDSDRTVTVTVETENEKEKYVVTYNGETIYEYITK